MTDPTARSPFRILGTIVLVLLLSAQFALAQDQEYGVVDFSTSCSAEAQETFDTGLALLHHMMYGQAVEHFERSAEHDPSCAMAHWGIAMTQLRPLWAPPTEEEFEGGRSAVKEAQSLEASTEREQAHIEALDAYYTTAAEGTHREGVQNWETALQGVHKAFPEDVDAAAFWALSHLATAPADDDTYAHQKRAGKVLEGLLDHAPRHPGAFHYLIHAYDNPLLAEEAVEVARAYDKLAPDVPHALHMPSHIFVRLGIWPDVIDWNRRSADVALDQSSEEQVSLHHVHALDYMVYAYLQRGEDQKAEQALQEILEVGNYQAHPASAYGIAAAQARYAMEREQWTEAANLPLRAHDRIPWDNFPEHESITYWARGMGAIQLGDLETARSIVDTLDAFHERTLDKGEDYWAIHVDVRRKTIQAWLAHAEGESDRALELMREAAERESSVGKHPITPSEVLPAQELLGDLLMEMDRPEEALEAYQAALEMSPKRLRSLYGAGRAAEETGQPDVAETFYATLSEMTEGADSDRPYVTLARDFLGQE